jgi:hypothetical protein
MRIAALCIGKQSDSSLVTCCASSCSETAATYFLGYQYYFDWVLQSCASILLTNTPREVISQIVS